MDEITKRFSEELNENIQQLKSRLDKELNYRINNLSDLKFLFTKKSFKKDAEMIKIASTLDAK